MFFWLQTWEAQAKAVCQLVHPRERREWLQSRLKGGCAELAKTLAAGCDRFAVWRWKTLSNVTRDLLRMKDALLNATNGLRACDLGSRDSVIAHAVLMAVQYQSCQLACPRLLRRCSRSGMVTHRTKKLKFRQLSRVCLPSRN